MELTGNNKKAFAKYLRKQRFGILFDPEKSNNPYVVNPAKMFEKLPLSMQFGVVVDYADSIDIFIEITYGNTEEDKPVYRTCIFIRNSIEFINDFKTRDEARLAAIKAFDEIVNRDTRIVKHKK